MRAHVGHDVTDRTVSQMFDRLQAAGARRWPITRRDGELVAKLLCEHGADVVAEAWRCWLEARPDVAALRYPVTLFAKDADQWLPVARQRLAAEARAAEEEAASKRIVEEDRARVERELTEIERRRKEEEARRREFSRSSNNEDQRNVARMGSTSELLDLRIERPSPRP